MAEELDGWMTVEDAMADADEAAVAAAARDEAAEGVVGAATEVMEE